MQGVSGDLVIFLSSTILSYTRHLPALEASARPDPLATPPWMILLPISIKPYYHYRICRWPHRDGVTSESRKSDWSLHLFGSIPIARPTITVEWVIAVTMAMTP